MTEEVNCKYWLWYREILVVERHKFQLVHQPVLVALVLGLYLNRHRDTSVRRDIKVSTVEFTNINEIVRILTDKTNEISTSKILKDQENKLFGTSNDDIIKMQLYRHCKKRL
jgi:hypothetical protein